MLIQYDKQADAAYIYIKYPIKYGESERTEKVNNRIFIDYSKTGKLLGIEILDASKLLDKKLLKKAIQIA